MIDREQNFFGIIKKRSEENETGMDALIEKKCYALIGAIIRMELDSLIRVYYYNESDSSNKEDMLDKFFNNTKWGSVQKFV